MRRADGLGNRGGCRVTHSRFAERAAGLGRTGRTYLARHVDSAAGRSRRAWSDRGWHAPYSRTGVFVVSGGNNKLAARHIHLLGIAGAAMAPVAGMLKERGFHR